VLRAKRPKGLTIIGTSVVPQYRYRNRTVSSYLFTMQSEFTRELSRGLLRSATGTARYLILMQRAHSASTSNAVFKRKHFINSSVGQ